MPEFSVARRSTRRLGRRGENVVCRLYRRLGCELLARNWRCRAGELDLVFRDGGLLRFVEVKSRRYRRDRTPAENLSLRQARRNYHAAEVYFRMIGMPEYERRFDLVEVEFGRFGVREIRRIPDYLPARSPDET